MSNRTPEERAQFIISRMFGDSLDSVRYRQNYPDAWKDDLRQMIVREIEHAIEEATLQLPTQEEIERAKEEMIRARNR